MTSSVDWYIGALTYSMRNDTAVGHWLRSARNKFLTARIYHCRLIYLHIYVCMHLYTR